MTDKNVYLVVMDRGGLFGAYFDRTQAESTAESIGAAVAAVPILVDHRPTDVSPYPS